MKMYFTDLSPGDLCHIVELLSAQDISRLAQTCRYMQQICDIESVWKNLCIRECNLLQLNAWDGTYKDIYTQVVHKFGKVCGLWRIGFYPYGGLALIKEEDDCIIAYEVKIPGHDATKALQFQPLFKVTLTNGKLQTECMLNGNCSHQGELIKIKNWKDTSHAANKSDLSFKCMAESYHPSVTINRQEHTIDNIENVKAKSYQQRHLRPLIFSSFTPCKSQSTDSPVLQGLYKGDYNIHGIEILHVTLNSAILSGVKITGDPNIPATKTSFIVQLTRPFDPYGTEGLDFNPLFDDMDDEIDDNNQQIIPEGMKRFHLPFDIEEGNAQIPKFYKSMFWAEGQVAMYGFNSPDFIPALFVVFEESMFGVIFWDLHSFAIFVKIEEALI